MMTNSQYLVRIFTMKYCIKTHFYRKIFIEAKILHMSVTNVYLLIIYRRCETLARWCKIFLLVANSGHSAAAIISQVNILQYNS